MIKRLLFSAMAAGAMAFSANAAEVTLWEGSCNFGTSWAESFAIAATDLSVLPADEAVIKLEYTLDGDCTYWQYKPCSNASGWAALKVAEELGNDYSCISVDAGSTSTTFALGAEDIATVKANGMRMQGYGMTVTKVTVDTDAEINENLLWEGEYTITGWNSGAEFASSKVKAGDILCYTFTEAGASNAQVLLKNSSWGNLLGTTKIIAADMAKGSVYVGVTQDMLDNCGGKIFVQGDGGCVLTKVEKTGETFNPEGMLMYGARVPGVSVFTPIPTDATKVTVELSGEPEYIQFCNSSWADQELASEKKTVGDNVIVTFTLTPEVIAAVNATEFSEFIINANAAVTVNQVYVGDPRQVGISDITADENAPVEFFNLQGMRISEPAAGQVVIRRQGNKVQKMLVK